MDPVAAGVARSNGAEILAADISELGANCEAFFDAITLSHVIEHVHDPVDTLIRCHRMLKPGGYLWLETPNADSVGYELYGRYWRGLEPPRHLVIFNSAALEMTLARAGFERIATLPPLDLAAPMFALSAAMRLGRIAEADATQLPRDVRARVEAAARQAGSVVAHNPSRSEFVNLIAYRPPSERGETWSMR
jgi:2-polyprenyl-3-methyl-5-hydroxy-6-metoxy-1,4-benzoquinol methylase